MNKIEGGNFQPRYDVYLINKEQGKDFKLPKNCEGSIGITLDKEMKGLLHSGLEVLNKISMSNAGVDSNDSYLNLDLQKMAHVFTLIGRGEKNKKNPGGESYIEVVEAVASGIIQAKISMDDDDWTSMVLFVPRDPRVRAEIIQNSHMEVKPDEQGQIPQYNFVAGLVSIFSEKMLITKNADKNALQANKSVIASEVADYLKGKGVKDQTHDPKKAICSQLATRILRASTMISSIPHEHMGKYIALNKADLYQKLLDEMTGSHLEELYWSSEIFRLPTEKDALPYELYNALMKESNIVKSEEADAFPTKESIPNHPQEPTPATQPSPNQHIKIDGRSTNYISDYQP